MQVRSFVAVTALGTVVAVATAGTGHYTVQPGDTLSAIAARTGVSLSDLVEENDLGDPDHIRAGEELSLGSDGSPGDSGGSPGEDDAVHEVQPGETLSRLAARYRTSARAIARASRLADPDRIRVGERLVIPDAGSGVPAAGAASRTEIATLLEQEAQAYGWNPAFVKALAWQESGWNPHVVSYTGAVGVMQVLPSTGRFISEELVGRGLELSDPADNVEAGVAFLDYLWKLTEGDPEMTLAGYYQGLRSVREHGMAPDTERYVDNVLSLRNRF